MKFLKKDINRRLLVLIVFFLVIFIGFTVYYEYTIKKVLNAKSQTDDLLVGVTGNSLLQKLNQTDKLKEIALLDKAVLEDKYNQLSAQNENLKKEKENLEQEIIVLKSEIEYNDVKMDGPVEQFRLIQNRNKQISELKKIIDSICSRLNSSSVFIKECS
ncbi:MAG: hypothetical protein AABX25_03380 [Nanoarchaeota archaeon]